MTETQEEIADRIAREHIGTASYHDAARRLLRDDVLSALRHERERCAKVLESRADELQAEWDAPPSAENGFIAMTADTPAGYATYYAMNQLRKLAANLRRETQNGDQQTS